MCRLRSAADRVSILADDLDGVLERAREDLLAFRGMRVYVTGGTGFVGTWLLMSIVHANARAGARIAVDVLTRDPQAFARREPALAGAPGVRLVAGDVRCPPSPDVRYDAVVQAATPASATFNDERPGEMLATILDGQRAVLELAGRSGRVPLLFTSSGAVYGRQPPHVERVGEDERSAPDVLDPRSAYHEGKRVAELLAAIACAQGGPAVKVARMFAFVGPYLPIDRHLAVGNFLRDALDGAPIVVGGDGTPLRSYLYAADLAAWLWAVFARGAAGRAYNVGSEAALDIAALARAVAAAANGGPVEVRGTPVAGRAPERYVPDTSRARSELGVAETVGLDQALRRTMAWHRERRDGDLVA